LAFTSNLPTLPLGLYQTFVLEEQHGFNKTTLTLYFADMLKGWALGIVIGTPLLSAFLYIFEWAGDRFVPWIMMLLWVSPTSHIFSSHSPISQACLPAFDGNPLPNGDSTSIQQTFASP
jgi:STE24 endopeptidase